MLAIISIIAALVATACSDGPKYEVIKDAPEFTLENVDGSEVSLQGTNGKVRLIYFYFSHCPDVCQPTNFLLSKVQEELKKEEVFGSDTALMSITFDPKRDTIERLQEYSAGYGADYAGWYFLRGEVKPVRELAKEYGIAIQELESGDFGHSNLVMLVDKEGKLRNYYMSDDLDPSNAKNIAKDMIQLAKE